MKPIPLRARPLEQADLFDGAAAPARLTSLQMHRVELVELLSQLLWQVARHAEVAQQLEDDDEQDQP
jgi:DNA-binding TFAR19-related protein (PDSD5 family)